MENNFKKIIERALIVKKKYSEVEKIKWDIKEQYIGFVEDVGELGKFILAKQGYRDDINNNADDSLRHELSDLLFSIIVIADKLGVDLEKSFYKTMDELDERLK